MCETRWRTSRTPTSSRSTPASTVRVRSSTVAAQCASSEDLTLRGVLRGRRLTGADVLEWWERTQVAEREVLLGLDPALRVPWGLGMRPPSFVTARMMETWAHGLDVHDAVGRRARRHGPPPSRGLDRSARAPVRLRGGRRRGPGPGHCGSSSRSRPARRGRSDPTTPPTASPAPRRVLPGVRAAPRPRTRPAWWPKVTAPKLALRVARSFL